MICNLQTNVINFLFTYSKYVFNGKKPSIVFAFLSIGYYQYLFLDSTLCNICHVNAFYLCLQKSNRGKIVLSRYISVIFEPFTLQVFTRYAEDDKLNCFLY